MTLFLLLAAAMLALALLFVLPVLWRRESVPAGAPSGPAPRDALNLAVHRDQLRELELDFRLGSIGKASYQHARQELAHRVAEEVKPAAPPLPAPGRQRWPTVAVALGLCGSTVFLYAMLGTPAALLPGATAAATPAVADSMPPVTAAQIEGMVARLAEKMKANPQDAEGWRKLARAYETLRRFDLAVDAYEHLLALTPDNPDLLADYAVTLAMSLDQRLTGAPEKLIQRALQINPDHVQALALSGSAAFERQDYAGAVKAWKKILDRLPPDAEMAPSIAANIAKAQSLGEVAAGKM
ncbi:MAG: c-type cytochrome biogenesis protein CcmI [Polaromonas sp.]|nr:c-type cytochrome biogenesis protein CcmI [Polaromonas sp.]